MKNKDVCYAFLNKEKCVGSNLTNDGNKLFSYYTCIAEWFNDTLLLNGTKYSVTTSKHQGILQRAFNNCGLINIKIHTLYNVERGTQSLYKELMKYE